MNALMILSGLGLLSLISEIFNFKKRLFLLILIGLPIIIVAAVNDWGSAVRYFNDMLWFDNFAVAFTCLIVFIALLWFIFAQSYFTEETHITDHSALVLFALAGAVVMVSYSNMTMLFIGIEILSLALYVLAGSKKDSLASNEAALKYFLTGSFATGFLLFGITLIYGATGSFHLQQIAAYTSANQANIPGFFYIGVLLMLVGLAFKVSAAPFHSWAPDVYQGSPTVVTAFMATIVKMAAFAAFFRLFYICFVPVQSIWGNTIFVMAILTLGVGNITAVYQDNVKRMLAYSSVAHAGYMLLAILAMNATSASAILYYTATYSIATITAFVVLYNVIQHSGQEGISAFNGLYKRNPLLTAAMTIAILSLAGIPPMAGFFAKYYIFTAALQSGQVNLVIVAVIASLIGIFYYFRIIIAMYFKEAPSEEIEITGTHKILIIITILLTLILGIFPDLIIRLI